MVLYEVFSHPLIKHYKTSIFSKATLLQVICITLTYLSPFLIAYFAGGFWIREKTNSEQPVVRFQYRYIVLLETDNNVYLSTSYENVNQIYANQFLPAVVSANEVDENRDGINDYLDLSISMSGIPQSESVKNVKMLLLLNTSLSLYATLQFESIGYLECSNNKKATEINMGGELQFIQREKLTAKSINRDYAYLYLDQNNEDLETLAINKILKTYYSRPFGTRLLSNYMSWSSPIPDGFNIVANIRYNPFQATYTPAFWEQFKWGWIQYIAVLIPFLYVFERLKIFIFENQLVETIVIDSNKRLKCS